MDRIEACAVGGYLDIEKLTEKFGSVQLIAVSCGKTNVYDMVCDGDRTCVEIERSGAVCALS